MSIGGTTNRGNMEDKYNTQVDALSNLYVGKAFTLPHHS
jgi:hypothetical protein